jgi:glycosyltransferase involved in cell wall biosynthesis
MGNAILLMVQDTIFALRVPMERVVFVVNAREFGGLEIVLLDWLSAIDYSKVSVVLCCQGTNALREKLAASGLPVELIKLTVSEDEPFGKAFPKWLHLFSSIRPQKIVMLEAVLSELNVTPVFAAWWDNRARIFLFEANWGRSVLTPYSEEKRKLHYGFLPGIGLHRLKEIVRQRLRGRLAYHTFVVSQGIKDNLVSHYGYPAERTSVLYHGVDTQRFKPSPAERSEFRQVHGIPDDATVIVSHGRLVQRKRVDRILKAFEILYAQHPNLWVLLTCYGPLKEEVERMVAGSAACDRIKLVGFQGDSSRVLNASDIYVLSSNDEGFGIALVEALSTGLVCVATNGPGPRDIIKNCENGLLVDASDEGVQLGLQRALSLNQNDRDRLTLRARKTVEERFEISMAIQSALDAMQIPRR